jgi:hypothetical protein
LEKKINDLKVDIALTNIYFIQICKGFVRFLYVFFFFSVQLATQGTTYSEGERLAQELHMIEAGIREKEKDVCNWSPYSNMAWIQPPVNLMANQNSIRDFKPEEVNLKVMIFS